MHIQIKQIKDSDIKDAISLHNLNYGDKRTPKQWVWEYKGNHPDLFVFTIIKDNDRVVGTQGMIPIYLNIKGKTYLSGKSENSLLDPKYRGRGLFTQLYDFALSLCKAKKMCCVWGFTVVTRAIKVLSRLGFSVYEDAIYTSLLILSPRRFISFKILGSRQSLVTKIAKSLLVTCAFLYSFIHRFTHRYMKGSLRKFSIEEKLRSANDLGKLYKCLRVKYANLIHIEQNEEYITWRIFNNPNIEYTTYFVYEDNLLRAYCYVNIDDKNNAYLTDLTFEDYEAGDFLLKTILVLLYKRKITSALFVGNIENPLMATIFNLLKEHGFIKRRSSTFVLKNIFDKHEKSLYNIKNWYLNGLWTEGYTW